MVCSQQGWNLLLLQQMTSLQVIVERLLAIKGSYSKEIFSPFSSCPVTSQKPTPSKSSHRFANAFTHRNAVQLFYRCPSVPRQHRGVPTGSNFSQPVFVKLQLKFQLKNWKTEVPHDATTEFKAIAWAATAMTRIWKSNCFSDQKQTSVLKAWEGTVFLSFYT